MVSTVNMASFAKVAGIVPGGSLGRAPGLRPRNFIIAALAVLAVMAPLAGMGGPPLLPPALAVNGGLPAVTQEPSTPSSPVNPLPSGSPAASSSSLPGFSSHGPPTAPPPAPPGGLKLEIEPLKRIYSFREGLMVRFLFTAQSRTKLCLAKDLLSQMQVSISRAGTGRLPLQPLVMRDNSALFQEKMQVRWLEPGQSVSLRANLKRYRFAGGEQWTPGEYNVAATFNLCAQTPEPEVYAGNGEELPVKAVRAGWFMIMI